MSLVKQLWVATAALMILVFVGSFLVSTHRAQDYFEEQLIQKNMDSAGSLALALSHVEKEPVFVERLVAAQFDTGHYRRIELVDPEGRPIVQKNRDERKGFSGPDWFVRLLPLEVAPGVAHIQEGWTQYGTLYVQSTSSFARDTLWQTTRELFLLLLGVAAAFGVLGSLIIKRLTRPLDEVVLQAEAIGERRFIKSSVPRTLEFALVVKAMNNLSDRVRQTLETEGQRLEDLRRQTRMDRLTGLANREQFIALLDSLLEHEDREAGHGLVLLRVKNLKIANQKLGFQRTNEILQQIAELMKQTLEDHADKYRDAHLARIKGIDFAMVLQNAVDLHIICNDLLSRFKELEHGPGSPAGLTLPYGAGYFRSGEERGSVLMRLSSLLAAAELQETTCAEIAVHEQPEHIFASRDQWRNSLEAAINAKEVQARYFPVLTMDKTLIHHEAMIRLPLAGEMRNAGSFVPWARRLGLLPLLDLEMFCLALSDLKSGPEQVPIAVNLDILTLKEPSVREEIIRLLSQNQETSSLLNLELFESSVLKNLDLFLEFCDRVQPFGCGIGLERAGSGFSSAGRLQTVGLKYLKTERDLVHDIANQPDNRNFLRGLCILGHSVGLQIIATGVQKQSDMDILQELGVDGVTGPVISL
jgi:EAL domain-containing protein (putative c-di-GMP-specific phosphodiesterase class I)/GGDEF domain-containing protein